MGNNETREELIAQLSPEHLAPFVPQAATCPGCGHCRVEWTIRHGEAVCIRCSWPARLFHYVEGSRRPVVVPLYYRPSLVSVPDGHDIAELMPDLLAREEAGWPEQWPPEETEPAASLAQSSPA